MTTECKRLRDVEIDLLGRSFDDAQSSCLWSERLVIGHAFALCRASLSDNLVQWRAAGLLANDVVFDILDEPGFSAFAVSLDESDIVALHAGVPIALIAIFFRMLSTPAWFPWVGAAAEEATQHEPFDGLPDSFTNDAVAILSLAASEEDRAMILKAVLESDVESKEDYREARLSRHRSKAIELVGLAPMNKERRLFCTTLLHWALQFILYHEIGHILHGHVAYARELGRQRYDEVDGGLEAAVRRSQEYQADTFASIVTIFPILLQNQPTLPPWFRGHPGRAVYAWAVVLSTVFSLLTMLEGSEEPLELRDHPYPRDRLTNAFSGALIRARMQNLETTPGDLALALEAWEQVDAFMETTIPSQYRREFLDGETKIIQLSRDRIGGAYPFADMWERFDRLKALATRGGPPLKISYRY